MSFSYELFGTPDSLVMDPLHGGIPFFKHELGVIDHPLFQRLRHVGQNDVTSMVFPGTTHSRFLHSIGATHVASKIFKGLIRTYILQLPEAPRPQFRLKHVAAVQYFHYVLRLATLLHDVGHLPFSHHLESGVPEVAALLNADLLKSIWAGTDYTKYHRNIPDVIDHEYFSVVCAHSILGETYSKQSNAPSAEDVLGVMEKTDVLPSQTFVRHAKNLLPLFFKDRQSVQHYPAEALAKAFQRLLHNIIASELGADRMDYMLRDSYFSGSKYGIYNLDHLVSNLRVGFNPERAGSVWVGIAVPQKGMAALEDFVGSRFQLYLNVYNHKAVVGMKVLLTKAIQEVVAEKKGMTQIKRHLSDLGLFAHFTDTYLWERFHETAQKNPASACAMLLGRKKLKWLQTEKDIESFRKEDIKHELEAKYGGIIEYKEAKSKFSKLGAGSVEIRQLITDPLSLHTRLESIYYGTTFFDKYRDIETVHFYQLPEVLVSRSEPPGD